MHGTVGQVGLTPWLAADFHIISDRLQLPFSHVEPTPKDITLAIASEDSSIVYYKIAKGIVAPKEVKD